MHAFCDFLDIGFNEAIYKHAISNHYILLTLAGLASGFVNVVEGATGLKFIFVLFFLIGSIFDIGLGVYTNVIYFGKEFSSSKFFKGIVKMFIVFVVIILLNLLVQGLAVESPGVVDSVLIFFTAAVRGIIIMILALVILIGIVENADKMEMKGFGTLAVFLRLRVKYLSDSKLGAPDSLQNDVVGETPAERKAGESQGNIKIITGEDEGQHEIID